MARLATAPSWGVGHGRPSDLRTAVASPIVSPQTIPFSSMSFRAFLSRPLAGSSSPRFSSIAAR